VLQPDVLVLGVRHFILVLRRERSSVLDHTLLDNCAWCAIARGVHFLHHYVLVSARIRRRAQHTHLQLNWRVQQSESILYESGIRLPGNRSSASRTFPIRAPTCLRTALVYLFLRCDHTCAPGWNDA